MPPADGDVIRSQNICNRSIRWQCLASCNGWQGEACPCLLGCIKNVKALLNCLGALSVKLFFLLLPLCFCLLLTKLLGPFGNLQLDFSFCHNCLPGLFLRLAMGQWFLKKYPVTDPKPPQALHRPVWPCLLLMPKHHLQPAVLFHSSVHLEQ